MEDCIFCKIANKEIRKEIIFEDDKVIAFEDNAPKAKVHILIITKEHIASTNDFQDHHTETIGKLILAAKKIAMDKGIAEKGYKLVLNCGKDGGQMVPHIHVHLLGGGPVSGLV